MAKLKPWYRVVIPREDLRENRPLDASEFAVHLDHIRDGRAHPDYVKPERFFERTYLTTNLLELASQVVRRLSGIPLETSSVFNMATQFGGGKTHSLTTLYHLAKNGERAKGWKGVDRILTKANAPQIPKADVAVFVGTEFDVITGRSAEGEPLRKTPWGEIAWQLGGEKSFKVVAEHDARVIAPAGDVIREMLPNGPALILMDELINYVSRGRKLGLRDALFDFLQNLVEEVTARKNTVLCASIPASELEMNPEDQRDHESLKKLLDRKGKAIIMSAETEIAEIIRRRLFEWGGLPDDGRKTANEYAEWAAEHAQELVGVDPDMARETFQACYPFHPSVLSVFERKWQSLPRFQRTRGVLRLLALWVAHSFQEEHRKAAKEPLISLGSAPIENPMFRAAMFEQLGSADLEIPVTTDIAGKSDAHALRLDKEATDAIKKARLHKKVATTIFFESNGGMSQAKADASVPEIQTSVGGPELNLANVDPVLEGLNSTCYYLTSDHNRYRFGLAPNLNKILVTRRGAVQPKSIDECIKQRVEQLFNKDHREIDRRYAPARSNDVPNRPVLTLVVMGFDTLVSEKRTDQLMEEITRECGSSGRTFKSALIFAVPDAAEVVKEAARNLLAWEDINDDEDTKKQLDDSQRRQLAKKLNRAKSDLEESVWRAYRYLYLLGDDNKLRQIDLGQITSSMAGSPVEHFVNELSRTDEITPAVSPNKLLKYWPPALTEWPTKSVRDAFYSSPQLPRLLDADAIKQTIADGVAQGVLGYATKDDKGNLQLIKFDESMSESEVEFADYMFILDRESAQKLLEPPRLHELVLSPGHVTINVGEQAGFTVSAKDQYGQDFPISGIEWAAQGGEMSSDGLFTAAETAGQFTVTAKLGAVEGTANVRITEKSAAPMPTPDDVTAPAGNRMLCWDGEVPPQKWMNFYTKVLSKFATSPDFRLRVRFEIPLPEEVVESKAGDARSGLQELSLDDDVTIL